MSTRSYTSLRRLKAMFSAAMLAGASLCGYHAIAQAPSGVVSSSVASWAHTGSLGQLWNSAVSSRGEALAIDFKNNALYQFPANAGPVMTLYGNGKLGSGYADMGIAIDPRNNNLYVDSNYGGGLNELPYDAAKGTWDLPAVAVASSLGGNAGTCGSYFQTAGLAINDQGVMVVGTQGGCGQGIFTVPIDSSGSFGPATQVVLAVKSRARNVAIDHAGNIYFNEDGGNPGVFYVPAGSTNLADETKLTRIDPQLTNISGVSVDPAGNVYIADATAGVYWVPLQNGVPNPAAAVLLTTASAQGNAAVDASHGILDVPINSWNGFSDAVKVYLNRIEFGTLAVGSKTPATGTVYYSFTGPTTPHSFSIQQAGSATNFILGTGGTCTADSAQNAGASCTIAITFNAQRAGDLSAELFMLDKGGNILATTLLHGIGQAAQVTVTPSAEAALATGVAGASQVATDSGGSVYVAASGQVLQYPAGSTTAKAVSLGTGLVAPTGVAVDGAGDVFIADSGKVIEIPNGPTGLNAAGQAVIQSGLGTKLQLASDSTGDVFVLDPDNKRVVRLGGLTSASFTGVLPRYYTSFTQATAIAADGSGDLFIVNGSSLVEISFSGVQTTLLTSLSGATGLAVDPSGSVYVVSGSGTVRIPNESGTLNPADQVIVAADVASPVSIALDSLGDAFLTDAAGDVKFVSASGFFNFGTLTSTSGSATQNFTILNTGNAPLTITGFAGTADFTAASTSCISAPLAIDATCAVTATFQPGPGDQGALTGTVLVTGTESNIPVGIMGTGVGAALLASKTTVTVTNANVDGAPAAVTVAPSTAGGATPTGQVSLSVTGSALKAAVVTTGTLANGTVTITPPQLAAGTYTFTANYIGDRVYGKSTASTQVTVAAGPVNLVQPTMAAIQQAFPSYPYVLAAGAGAAEPYDGSVTQFEPNYQVKVVATDGVALIGLPIIDPKTGKLVATNYGSVTFQGAPSGSNCAALPVAADGTVSFAPTCLSINTTNGSIPNFQSAYTLTPVYSPAGAGASLGTTNPNYTTQTGTPIAFTALRNPMVQISASPSAVTVTNGSSTTVTLSLSSLLGYGIAGSGSLLNNYSLPLQLACDGLPAYATCTFSYPTPDPTDPQSVDVGPAAGTVLSYRGATAAACTVAQGCVGPGTVKMTITTNVPPTGATASLRNEGQTAFAAMFGVGMLGFLFGKRKSLRGRLLLLVCLLACGSMTAGITGCSTTQLGTAIGTPSPTGTYAVIVTARQVGSQVITQYPGIVYGNQNQMSLPFTMNLTVQ